MVTSRSLDVWMNGYAVGRLTKGAAGEMLFVYADAWIAQDGSRSISLSMPLRQALIGRMSYTTSSTTYCPTADRFAIVFKPGLGFPAFTPLTFSKQSSGRLAPPCAVLFPYYGIGPSSCSDLVSPFLHFDQMNDGMR